MVSAFKLYTGNYSPLRLAAQTRDYIAASTRDYIAASTREFPHFLLMISARRERCKKQLHLALDLTQVVFEPAIYASLQYCKQSRRFARPFAATNDCNEGFTERSLVVAVKYYRKV